MTIVFIGAMIGINLFIAAFNAWSVGKSWAETREIGGLARFMAWCGAIMSACGFTIVYLFALAWIADLAGWLNPDQIEALFSLGYLIIIFPVLGTGLAIMVHSWAIAWRSRRKRDVGIAGWNTFANVYNYYNAINGIPDAFSKVGDLFSSDSSDSNSAASRIVLALAVLAVVGGILTTTVIIRTTARRHAQDQMRQMRFIPAPT